MLLQNFLQPTLIIIKHITELTKMPKRSSPQAISNLDDLTHIDEIVLDKRNVKRSNAKKGRRDRHTKNQLIKNTLKALLNYD